MNIKDSKFKFLQYLKQTIQIKEVIVFVKMVYIIEDSSGIIRECIVTNILNLFLRIMNVLFNYIEQMVLSKYLLFLFINYIIK